MAQRVEVLKFVLLLQCVSHLRPLDDVDNGIHVSDLSDAAVDEQFRSADKRNLSLELAELFLVSCHHPVWVGFD